MAGQVSYSLTFKGDLEKNLSNLPVKARAAAFAIVTNQSMMLEQYMKANRPWTDRTGRAKAGLKATPTCPSSDVIEIILSHSVSYGVYLEFAMEKRFAILYPTVDEKGAEVVNAFNGAMNRLVRGY